MLSRAQIDEYRTEGCIVVPDVLDENTRASMKRVLDDLCERSRAVAQHDDVYDLEPGHSAADPRVRRIKKPHQVHPVFREFMVSPKLVAILRALLGPAVRLHGSKLNLKSPRFGSPVEWHQDWAFYPHTNDDLLAVGVMLDDARADNGAMLYLPGTHTGPTYDHHQAGVFCGAMDPEACGLDFSKALCAEGRAGSISLHHVRLVHGSAQNTSDRPRALLLYEMAAADAFPLMGVGNYDEFNGRLICGEPTIVPRLRDLPVRMPLPPARNQGSIYENQTAVGRRYFERTGVPADAAV
jgi:ectoine hydroxylase-related dioxygenase (phytanoyl-CoA dioxygenase family)